MMFEQLIMSRTEVKNDMNTIESKSVIFENGQKFVEKSEKCKLKCFGILATRPTTFGTSTFAFD